MQATNYVSVFNNPKFQKEVLQKGNLPAFRNQLQENIIPAANQANKYHTGNINTLKEKAKTQNPDFKKGKEAIEVQYYYFDEQMVVLKWMWDLATKRIDILPPGAERDGMKALLSPMKGAGKTLAGAMHHMNKKLTGKQKIPNPSGQTQNAMNFFLNL